jgi:hypothetical protein
MPTPVSFKSNVWIPTLNDAGITVVVVFVDDGGPLEVDG